MDILRIRTYVSTSAELSLDEVSELVRAPRPMIERLVSEDIVQPLHSQQKDEPIKFTAVQVREIERSLRLHEELGVNWAGIAIIQQLLGQLEQISTELSQRARGDGRIKDTTYE